MKIRFNVNVSLGEKSDRKTEGAPPKKQESFTKYVEEETAHARRRNSFSTADNYTTALRSLLDFLGRRDVAVGELSPDVFEAYQRWLLARGLALNTISCYMRSLRSVYNRSGCGDTAVFGKVFTGHAPTSKRSVCADDIRRLLELKLRQGSRQSMARDIFVFSFYCQGMPFVDVAHLRKSQIVNGHIRYLRKKTGQSVDILVEPCMARIMRRYDDKSADYVFPIITSANGQVAHEQYLRQLSYYNHALKLIGRKAGINRPLTSYVARHSWASIAFQNNVDLQVISRAMGHTNPSTTLIYIKELDNERLARANRKIIEACGG